MDLHRMAIIKKAAEENAVNIEDIEKYLINDELKRTAPIWGHKGFNDTLLPYGYTRNVDAFVDSLVNVPLYSYSNEKGNKGDRILTPRNEKGERQLVEAKSPEELEAARQNTKAFIDDKGESWEAYKAALKQRKSDAIMASSVLAGGGTALAAYLGSGLIPRMRKYKVIRALLGLTAGAGAGWLYHATSNPSIYSGYDMEQIKNKINSNPTLAEKIVNSVNPEAGSGAKIDKIVSDADATKEKRTMLGNTIRRYGTDAAVGAASAAGAYALSDLIPYIKDKKALKMLLAGGVGLGAGALTDLVTRKG